MDALKPLSSLHCELTIGSAKNIQDTNSKGYLFVRCYLPAENNKRVRLESREIAPNGEYSSWNESFSLDCMGTKQAMDTIIQGTVVLELRCRSGNTVPLVGKIIGGGGGSWLLGSAEVSWRGIFESPNMELEGWVVMKSKKSIIKAPSVRIAMKIQVPPVLVLVELKRKYADRSKNKWDESCDCCHGHCSNSSCIDGEIFAIGAALDAF